MEFIMSSGIKIPNAVVVSGLLESPEDEIIDFLKKYGSMRLVPVTDINSEFYKNLIIEYQDGAAFEALAPLLPYTHELKDNPDVKYYVQALARAYTTKVGSSVTKAYLDEIKRLAKLSGRGFEEVLKDMMSEIGETIETDGSGAKPYPPADAKQSLSIVESDLNPPEVRKVIVEHIKSRKIFESLLSPAADIVKSLSPEATPESYLQLLDAAFGTVEDGEELFAQFMNTLQDPGEKASTYLCRLQAALNLAVKRGGAAAEEADRHILKQFCRGCWDNPMLSDLNL
ncbi:uncharacterized protein LOC109202349 [Tachysurus ichikawai]